MFLTISGCFSTSTEWSFMQVGLDLSSWLPHFAFASFASWLTFIPRASCHISVESGAKSAKQGSLHWAIQTNILPISNGIFQTMIYVIKIGLIEVVMNFCLQGFM